MTDTNMTNGTLDEGSKFKEILAQVRQAIDEKALGEKAWYLLIASVLTTSPTPELLAQFYTYLSTETTNFTTSEAQSQLSLEIRDILQKLITILGAPQVLSALIPFVKAENDQTGTPLTAATSTPSPGISHITNSTISAIHDRGRATLDTIYGDLVPRIWDTFGHHSADIQFTNVFTSYGLYLSDNTYLIPIEVELVVFVAIMCLGLRGPSLWHTRGMGRLLGARGTDEGVQVVREAKDVIRGVKIAAMAVVEFCGEDMVRRAKMESWVNVGDVVREIEGGWGVDEFVEPGRGNVSH